MTDFDLLNTVHPANGWFAIVGIKGKDVRQELVATREELDELADQFVKQKRNVKKCKKIVKIGIKTMLM